MQDKTLIRLAFQVFGAPVAYVLLQIDGFLGLKGWQWLFIMVGHSAKQLLETYSISHDGKPNMECLAKVL